MRFYWLRLKEDFFRDMRVKALRRYKNGDTLVLLYLQLLLSALGTGGVPPLLGLEAPADEIAMLLGTDGETAAALIAALTRLGLLETNEAEQMFLPAVQALTGSETASASRMRRQRENKDPPEETQNKADAASHCAHNVQKCDTEKEIEKESEKEIEIDQESEIDSTLSESPSSSEEESLFFLPTKEKKAFYVEEETIKEYAGLWPELDIQAELLAMRRWLLANPGRQKTAADTPRFINGWLSRSHEQARAAPKTQKETPRSVQQWGPQRNDMNYAGADRRHPASYDLQKAMEEMKTTVPKVKKKPKR